MTNDQQKDAVSRRSFLVKTATALGASAVSSLIPTERAIARPVDAQKTGDIIPEITYQKIGRWDVEKLNHILQVSGPEFTGAKVDYHPATNAVDLFRVVYPSAIPEKNNRPILASGLVAIPANVGKSARVVSYQHGTVYGKKEVPSFPDQSPETQLVIAAFAGSGDIVIGADYFGMGISEEPESYMVLGSMQQATADMIRAAQIVLQHRGIQSRGLYLTGWSEGGFATMGLLKRLQEDDVPVQKAATASAPVDPFASLGGILFFPRKNDAKWLNSIFVLSVFAFEHYYDAPGLAQAFLNPEYYDVCRKFYLRQPVDISHVPSDLHQLIRKEYFNPNYFSQSEYGRLLHRSEVFRWVIETPTRNYIGEYDEAITTGLGKLAMEYQSGMGNDKVQAISTGKDATHRINFGRSVKEWKDWFDAQEA